MILNKAQAKAIADAMRAVNTVYGDLAVKVDKALVNCAAGGAVSVRVLFWTARREIYPSQDAFMRAYGVAD